jgi:hypothetical protein
MQKDTAYVSGVLSKLSATAELLHEGLVDELETIIILSGAVIVLRSD